MEFESLPIGLKLKINICDKGGVVIWGPFASELQMVVVKNQVIIATPIVERKIFSIDNGRNLDIEFIYNDSLYYFKAKVLEQFKINNMYSLKVEVPNGIRSAQRRSYFRIKCLVPVKYRIFIPDNNTNAFKLTSSKDLSAGGIRLSVNEEVLSGQMIECEISLDEKKISFLGKVRRILKQDLLRMVSLDIGISFETISPKDKECIISFIFDEQRKLLKKGLR